MSFPCKYCGIILFAHYDHKIKYFEDEARSIPHNCPKRKTDRKSILNEKLFALTISRVSKLERQVLMLQMQIDISEDDDQ